MTCRLFDAKPLAKPVMTGFSDVSPGIGMLTH